MFKILDDLACQLFHGHWAEVVSYSRQGAWRCNKPGCPGQARHDRQVAEIRRHAAGRGVLTPVQARASTPSISSKHAA
jgi:hypothetical protein